MQFHADYHASTAPALLPEDHNPLKLWTFNSVVRPLLTAQMYRFTRIHQRQ